MSTTPEDTAREEWLSNLRDEIAGDLLDDLMRFSDLLRMDSFSFENYKVFPGFETIQLRPLTILIGRNNSGKSIVSRLPLQIAQSFSHRAQAPIELQFDGHDFGGSFLDLIHKKNPHGKLRIKTVFSSKDATVTILAEIQHFDDLKFHLVSYFEMQLTNNTKFSFTWDGKDPLEERQTYRINDTKEKCEIIFQGLLPKKIYHEATPKIKNPILFEIIAYIDLIRTNIAEEFDRITYLGPFREQPKRSYSFPTGRIRHVASAGKQAPALLADDVLRNKGQVLQSVSDWFSEHLGKYSVQLSQKGDTFSLVLVDPSNPNVEINIADVGTGIAQVLPIVVQRLFEAFHHQGGNLEIVEEPELHLHPGAHGDLADLYIDAVNHTDTRFILETHSENFLLRVRRRIAEGKLDNNKVMIYWVQDPGVNGPRILPIHVDTNGDVETWPDKVFSEDFEEVGAIRAAQRKRQS